MTRTGAATRARGSTRSAMLWRANCQTLTTEGRLSKTSREGFSMAAKRATTCRREWFVSLVSMPFKDLQHPPIQLGILESALARAGITARSHSLELAFMEHLHARTSESADGKPLTIEDYQQVALKAFVVQLGDWIFKVPPFAESAADDEAYLDYVRGETSEQEITNAARMRSLVPEFPEAAADELLAGSPRIVGFSSVFQQNVSSLVLA